MNRYTLGFISTWQIYEGTTIDPPSHMILLGIRAAAAEKGCNLLLSCGLGLPIGGKTSRPAWPALLPGTDYVPIGPWNVDGLIVAPHHLTKEQTHYLQNLMDGGFPIVFTATNLFGPTVAQDNRGGIYQAISHLRRHGHQKIAFIAGYRYKTGDYAERLQAYIDAIREAGLEYDDRLVSYGECSFTQSYRAMQQIMATGTPFTAVVANNDRSGLGAIQALREAGRRVPEDVAVIGFDNILESQAFSPALTTIHSSTYTLGYRLVDYMVKRIESGDHNQPTLRIPTRLIIRQSCNCQPGIELTKPTPAPMNMQEAITFLVHDMVESVLSSTQRISQDEVEIWCRQMAEVFISCLAEDDFTRFDLVLSRLLARMDELDEDALSWQNAILEFQRNKAFTEQWLTDPEKIQQTETRLDRARILINEKSRLQAARKLFEHEAISDRLSLMTAQFLAVNDESEIIQILSEHLGALQIRQVIVVLMEPEGDDPTGHSRILLDIGLQQKSFERQFPTRQFPPDDLVAQDEPFQLVVLPLIVNEREKGYVVFDTSNLEPCGSIARNLASALRNISLYKDALAGRQMAEEANSLKSHFLSMVSHELRTPLNLIVGLSEILLHQMNQPLASTENDQPIVERIYHSAQHLGWLINDVLDLASSEVGQLHLANEQLDLNEVMQVVIDTGQQLAKEKGLGWETKISSGSFWVMGDRTRLRQVALNLISNAIKYTNQGEVIFEITRQDDRAVIAVKDTGLGVPEGEQKNLFNEFHRSEVSIQRGFYGIGLGLAISKQLIELHQGSIGMFSTGKEGSGSTFFFSLPLIQVEEPTLGTSISGGPEKEVIAFLTDVLESTNPIIEHFKMNGIEVNIYSVDRDNSWMPKVLLSKPNAVIVEKQLASRQGLEILRALTRNGLSPKVPILVYAYDSHKDSDALLEFNYLQEPISPDNFVEMLKSQGFLEENNTPRTILVVDDDPGTLDLNGRLIQQQLANCKVLYARNGREAVAKIRESLPDLVLLDLMMPELDGFSVLEAMRESEQTRNIPVIIMTAKSLTEKDMERFNRAVVAVLNKGMFSSKETVSQIERILLSKNFSAGISTQKLVRKAVAYIHAHFSETIKREDIANYIGVNPDYLTACFDQELGISPMTYLNRYRISIACSFLETQDKKITEIAMQVGFFDSAHFSRIFQRELGVSPREYKRGKRANR